MSLDVTLITRCVKTATCHECGNKYLKKAEAWSFTANITHNLGWMAKEAGIYLQVWRPEEVGIKKASQMVNPLEEGLALLKSDPERFKKFEPENKWGTYNGFIEWLDEYLQACKNFPDADIEVSR